MVWSLQQVEVCPSTEEEEEEEILQEGKGEITKLTLLSTVFMQNL